MRATVKRIFQSVGYEVRRAQPSRREFLISRKIDAVIDVGANVGQFGRVLRRDGFSGRIFSFEPVSLSYQALVKRSEGDPKWKAYNVGLSNENGTATINVSEDTVYSSLHPTTPAASSFDPRSARLRAEVIQLRRLEEYCDQIVGENLFLKIDTQGHERQVMEGVGKMLGRVQGIQLELPISSLYADGWTMSQALDLMRKLGFVPTHFSPVSYHKGDDIAIVETDCIFRRYNPLLD